MKIEPTASSSLNGLTPSKDGTVRPSSNDVVSTGAPQTPPSGQEENVSFSPLATDLLSASASTSGDIDVQKVGQIKDALSEGTLSIDSGNIASGLLSHTLAVLQAQRQSGQVQAQ